MGHVNCTFFSSCTWIWSGSPGFWSVARVAFAGAPHRAVADSPANQMRSPVSYIRVLRSTPFVQGRGPTPNREQSTEYYRVHRQRFPATAVCLQLRASSTRKLQLTLKLESCTMVTNTSDGVPRARRSHLASSRGRLLVSSDSSLCPPTARPLSVRSI